MSETVPFLVLKSDAEKKRIITENVLTMLKNRVYVHQGDNYPLVTNPNPVPQEDDTLLIKADNGDTYALKIMFQVITSVKKKQTAIADFFKMYESVKKILVVTDYNNKIADYASKNNAQIFREHMLLFDLIRHKDQPVFQIMSPNEIVQLKDEYNVTDYTLKKMVKSDPIAAYYALSKGNVVRIIRASPTSGNAIDYRMVV